MLQGLTTTIQIADWCPDAIQDAAESLTRYDLRGATVVMWLFNDMVFEQLGTGDPLYRDP